MRAESSSSFVFRAALMGLLFISLVTTVGCKTQKDADAPTVLGRPAATAYLGVEYYYNFGAYGGENILDYSLSNAPSWLALEDTSNKARQGIIMRGVPGLTGGNRGRNDLGTTQNITLLTTDGESVGLQSFTVEVVENVLSLSARDYQEGASSDLPAGTDRETVCAAPDLGKPESDDEEPRYGEHQYQVEEYTSDGSVATTSPRTKPTTPVLVRVLLDQPSVIPTKVAFELVSDFDLDNCDDDFAAPHQECTYSDENRPFAIIGQDVIGLGSNSEAYLPIPDYLQYQEDDNGNLTKGVITLEAGITECFIRLEIVEDDIAERTESFRLELTDVREGLAALGAANAVVRQALNIDDNETAVSFETLSGANRDVINAGETRVYVATLAGRKNDDAEYRARLTTGPGTTAEPEEDYVIEGRDPDSPGEVQWIPVEELVFPAGVDEIPFRISAPNNSALPVKNDKVITLVVDQRFQDGRDYYAAPANDGLRVSINEFLEFFSVAAQDGFVPTDVSIGADGQFLMVGLDTSDPATIIPVMLVVDREGATPEFYQLTGAPGTLDAPPILSYSERSGDDESVVFREIAVALGTRGALLEGTNQGGLDTIQALFRFDSGSEMYNPVWVNQSGTSEDDIPRAVALDGAGNVFVGGETSGAWPENTSAGGIDTYVQRLDTELVENDENAVLAWTRQVGSGLDDRAHALAPQNTGALLIGSSRGAVNGEPQLGGRDYFFYNAFSSTGGITVRQRGTAANDNVLDALLIQGQIWLSVAPDRYERYETLNENNLLEAELRTSPLNSPASSVINYSAPDTLLGAVTLNDVDDMALDELSTMIAFDSDIIAAGVTGGRFGADASAPGGTTNGVFARVGRLDANDDGNKDQNEPSDPVLAPGLKVEERLQFGVENSRFIALTQYRDDKVFALLRQEAASDTYWHVMLFSGEGRLLNSLVPGS